MAATAADWSAGYTGVSQRQSARSWYVEHSVFMIVLIDQCDLFV